MNKIRKFQYGGPGYFIDRQNVDGLQQTGRKISREIAKGGLGVLGWLGNAFNTLITSGASTDYGQTSPFVNMDRTRVANARENTRQKAKQTVEKAMPYISPSNHIVSWFNGSLDPIVGAQKIAEASPEAQFASALFDIATFTKGKTAIKNTARTIDEGLAFVGNKSAQGRTIAREMNRNIKNPEILNNSLQTGLFVPNVTSTITGSPSLAFFERQPSKISSAERAGVPRGDRNFTPRWHVANYPGYQLKGLIRGSQLEKQLSKTGTININQLNAYFNKASQIEKEIANKILTERFAGQKTIDYNQFKKAVQDELIGGYKRVPQTDWNDYGVERLGYKFPSEEQMFNVIRNNELFYDQPDFVAMDYIRHTPQTQILQNYKFYGFPKLNTFTFESPRIPYGNTKHYGGNPLGHSRTFTTTENPHILYVMESQSDWAQQAFKGKQKPVQMNQVVYNEQTGNFENPNPIEYTKYSPQEEHLIKNYLQRQLQENLRYAAENGQTKMRYPTSETAAKIEGYKKQVVPRPTRNREIELRDQLDKMWKEYYDANKSQLNNFSLLDLEQVGRKNIPNYAKLADELEQLRNIPDKYDYIPEHKTILKKYADFPKLFQKLFKDQKVGTVTDAKGNTWYEIDVPKGYLNREWQFKKGGVLKFQYGGLTHYTPKQTKIINDVYKYLIDKGCTPVQAFALMGNIMQESSWDPQVRQRDGDRAYGLFQMHGDQYKAYQKYLQNTKRQDDLYAPLDYVLDMINETKDNNGILVAPHPYTIDYNRVLGRTDKEALDYREETYGKRERNGTLYLLPELQEAWNNPNISIDDLTTAFTNVFERPGKPEYDSRIKYANEYNTMFNQSHTKKPQSTEVPIIPQQQNFKIRDKMINKVKELTYEPTFSEILGNMRKTISVGGSYGRWKLGGKLRKHQLGGLIQTGLNFYNNAKLSNEFDEATDAIVKAARSKQQAKAYKYGLMQAEQLLSQLQSPDIHYSKDIDLPVLAQQIANSVYDEDQINQIKQDRLKEKSSIFNNTINSGNYDISGGLGILGNLFGLINKKTATTNLEISKIAPITLSGLFETPTLKAPTLKNFSITQ